VGRERIKEICLKHSLSIEDEKIIDNILDRWEHWVGNTLEKMEVVYQSAKKSPRFSNITRALLEINIEFMANVLTGKVAIPDSQGRYNIFDLQREKCSKGGTHEIRTDWDAMYCKKCQLRWSMG
jgi:hypothetical protein